MTDNSFLSDLPLAGELIASNFEGWPDWLRTEFAEHAYDGHVGSRLLSQNDRVRVWEIRLAPGERWHAHRHVLDYFWTAVTTGNSRQHTHDGTVREVAYQPGETRHFHFEAGEYLLHDIREHRPDRTGVHHRRTPRQRQRALGPRAIKSPGRDGSR